MAPLQLAEASVEEGQSWSEEYDWDHAEGQTARIGSQDLSGVGDLLHVAL